MEIRRTKNVASYIVFPIVDADGDLVSGAAELDSEIDHWSDGGAPDGFADCTNEATEIGTTGMYYLSLTQAESNYDYSVVQVKTSTSGAKTQVILINRTNQQSDVAAISGDTTAADNCELMFDGTGYAGGTTKLGVDAVAISGDTTAADNLESACDGTGYNLGGGDIVVASVTAGVTASTVSDKTGYALTAAYDAAKNAAPETGGNIAAIKSKTDNLPASPAAVGSAMTLADDAITAAKYDQSTAYPLASSDGSDLTACATAAGFSTHSAADVKTAIEAAGSHLTLVKAVTDKVDTALELDGAVYRYTTNALEQAPSGGLDAAGVRTALGMAAANLDDQLDALPTAAENADATWDEALSEHTNVGSAGAGLSAAGSAGDPWSTALPGAYGAGTAGQIVGDNVDGLAALIGSGDITVVSPVSEDGGTITIVQGDDYNNSDGRALEWSSDDWPDVTGAAITLYIEDAAGTYSEAGSVVTGGAGTQTVRVELPSADTATLDAGFQKFHVEAVLSGSSRVVTLATGVAHVIADIK